MKHFIPVLAVMAASLAAPVAAQNMSAFADVERMAARMGVEIPDMATLAHGNFTMPQVSGYGGANMIVVQNGAVASLSPDVRLLAPTTSLVPVPRADLVRIVEPEVVVPLQTTTIAALEVAPAADMADAMAEATRRAPAGANTAVISNGAGTVVVNSAPTRPSLWQRLFGG